MAPQRRFLGVLTVLAALVAVAQAVSGVPELALYLTPLFLLALLLLSGRYLGEDAIVRAWRGARRVARRIRVRRTPVPAAPLVSSRLERSPLSRRGPPVSSLLTR
jgi:hypothetical protein